MANSFGADILIQAEDPKSAASFYVQQLGFKITGETPRMISLHGKHSIVGRAVVIHEDEDDFGQPVGHAGNRLAAGVVGLTK